MTELPVCVCCRSGVAKSRLTLRAAARQASLRFMTCQSLLGFGSIITPSNHLILCHTLSVCLQSSPASVFSSECLLCWRHWFSLTLHSNQLNLMDVCLDNIGNASSPVSAYVFYKFHSKFILYFSATFCMSKLHFYSPSFHQWKSKSMPRISSIAISYIPEF